MGETQITASRARGVRGTGVPLIDSVIFDLLGGGDRSI